jgi:hypothetical protein
MVEATVMIALATTQGINPARRGTAKLERTPMPPPQRTNRAKETSGPGAVGGAGAAGVAELVGTVGIAGISGVAEVAGIRRAS